MGVGAGPVHWLAAFFILLVASLTMPGLVVTRWEGLLKVFVFVVTN